MPPGPSEFPDLPEPPVLSALEERLLVEAAVRSIHAFCAGLGEDDLSTLWSSNGEAIGPEGDVQWPGADQPLPVLSGLRQRSGVFVTIFQGEDLRGCLGLTQRSEPLLEAVPRMAHAAASRDTRFQPIDARDLPDLRVELTFLGPMTRLPSSPTSAARAARPTGMRRVHPAPGAVGAPPAAGGPEVLLDGRRAARAGVPEGRPAARGVAFGRRRDPRIPGSIDRARPRPGSVRAGALENPGNPWNPGGPEAGR